MGRDGLLIGEAAKKSGTSRKALRLYEVAGILAPPRRTALGCRVYGADTLELLGFVRQAQRLGFTLEEIKQIVSIKRDALRAHMSANSCAASWPISTARSPTSAKCAMPCEGCSDGVMTVAASRPRCAPASRPRTGHGR